MTPQEAMAATIERLGLTAPPAHITFWVEAPPANAAPDLTQVALPTRSQP